MDGIKVANQWLQEIILDCTGGPSVTIKARSWQVGGQSDDVRDTKVASCCL